MIFDISMIAVTAFAAFGVYSLFEMILMMIYLRNLPKSVTVMEYKEDKETLVKIRYFQNNSPNNIILLTSDKDVENNKYKDTKKILVADLENYINEELFTK